MLPLYYFIMKKEIFSLICLLFLGMPLGFIVTAKAQTTMQAGKMYTYNNEGNLIELHTPIANFSTTKYNLGNIEAGEPAHVDFTVKNVGNEPLLIADVKTSCGCTSPGWTNAAIMPGQVGFISARVETKGRSGSFIHTVMVLTNATDTPRQLLTLTGTVIPKPTNSDDAAPQWQATSNPLEDGDN